MGGYATRLLSRRRNDIFIHPRGRGCVKMLNVMLRGVLCFVPLNLICDMITIRKKKNIFTTPYGLRTREIVAYSMLPWCSMLRSC